MRPALTLRSLPWEFDESIPFQWNPSNPRFGLFINSVSFSAIAFEKYIVAAVRQAQPLITDAGLAEEADLFLRQEALHARAHRSHVKALIGKYPGLEETLTSINALYDDLLEHETLEFHLAYIADIEATFTPFFSMILNNQAELFSLGDDRVASIFLWHFSEEIEHRSSALAIYDHVVDNRWDRLRILPKVLRHASQVSAVVRAGFTQYVPEADRLVTETPRRLNLHTLANRLRPQQAAADPYPSVYSCVPRKQLLTMFYRLILSQTPHHIPELQPLPGFAKTWFEAYDSGRDVTHWYESARG